MSANYREEVKELAKLRITNILVEGKREKKTPQDLATEIIDVMEKECHYGVIEEE